MRHVLVRQLHARCIAHSKIVAEGVETATELAILRELGINKGRATSSESRYRRRRLSPLYRAPGRRPARLTGLVALAARDVESLERRRIELQARCGEQIFELAQ